MNIDTLNTKPLELLEQEVMLLWGQFTSYLQSTSAGADLDNDPECQRLKNLVRDHLHLIRQSYGENETSRIASKCYHTTES